MVRACSLDSTGVAHPPVCTYCAVAVVARARGPAAPARRAVTTTNQNDDQDHNRDDREKPANALAVPRGALISEQVPRLRCDNSNSSGAACSAAPAPAGRIPGASPEGPPSARALNHGRLTQRTGLMCGKRALGHRRGGHLSLPPQPHHDPLPVLPHSPGEEHRYCRLMPRASARSWAAERAACRRRCGQACPRVGPVRAWVDPPTRRPRSASRCQ